jgi:hypothetical protein
MHTQALGIAEHARDDEHALKVVRQEVAAAGFGALGAFLRMDLGVGEGCIGAAQQAQAGDVGDGLDVEDQDGPGTHGPESRRWSPGRCPGGSCGA